MRARLPDRADWIERDGVKLYYEVFGSGDQTIVFLPSWSIVHSRLWKAQIPYFARHFRVVTFDGAGNGRSDRPLDGTRAGASIPHHVWISYPGAPASVMAGTSGKRRERFEPVTPRALTLPARI